MTNVTKNDACQCSDCACQDCICTNDAPQCGCESNCECGSGCGCCKAE